MCSIDGSNFNSATGDYSLSTNDCVGIKPGAFKFRITGTVGTFQDATHSDTFDLNLVNPCLPECVTSSLTTPTISD